MSTKARESGAEGRIEPADDRVERLAGAMALRIAQIATEPAGDATRCQALTDYLLTALGADAVALFERRDGLRRGRPHASLHVMAFSSAHDPADGATERALKWVAYRAVAAGGDVAGTQASNPVTPTARHIMAVGLGRPHPHAYVVARWALEGRADLLEDRLLSLVAAPLAAAIGRARADDAGADESAATPQRALFSLTSEAILSVAEDFTVLDANPALHRLLGFGDREAIGRPCSEVIRCRDDRKVLLCGTDRCPLVRAFASATALPVCDISWEAQTGQRYDMSASVTVDRGAPRKRAVFVARDVTTLNVANAMRVNFISMVSHELRTPLNSINGFLEIVAEGQAGPLNAQQIEFLNYARVSTQQLMTLVEDVLFISKADSGQFHLRVAVVDVPKLVQQAVQAVAAQAEKGNVTLLTDVSPDITTVRGDDFRLQQVLTNLLGNAVKFSPSGGTVRLTVRREPDRLVFSVSDEGEGIPVEEHARIFERFYQSANASRSQSGGTGLGLAVAKLIVEQHGGTITVSSGADGGATFEFTLPTS